MKITAKKAAPDVYSLSFDDTEVALEGNDLKTLLIQITRLLRPAGELAKSGDERRKESSATSRTPTTWACKSSSSPPITRTCSSS